MTHPSGSGSPPPSQSLTAIADSLLRAAESRELTLEELLLVLGQRGLGAMLILPSLMIILPLGLVPGIPAIAALTMIFVAGHMALNRKRLWLPRRLAGMALPSARLKHELERFHPWAVRIDRWTEGRFAGLARSRFAIGTAAMITIALSLLIILIGFIPGIPAAFSLPILVFALGLAARNGLLILGGYVITILSLGLIFLLVR